MSAAASLQDFLVQQFETETKAFVSALEAVPEDLFAHAPQGGGHSVAWHALHIAEWTRVLVLQDFTASYGHLGWEDKEWTQKLQGPTRVTEQGGKTAVLVEVQAVFAEALRELRSLSDGALAGSAVTPFGERPLLPSLGGQLRHTAYHRGQIKLTALQLGKSRL
ncbi:DinB family protein [Deinococcus peraridilitoris]|uniref:DinB family protein n=1 Tax=Deinococcus peraridilitoris (strain DSM 19664 / LMG 22246 / CIP 109416 / KR-200) TaxID=937777 RepID=K9ZYL4_DEIPD|nr:DinB family protein [Deinococcus peraridilitoris]AFZ66294.1 DinB family protein [Deinococcus peraridilitoris DSM 19664]